MWDKFHIKHKKNKIDILCVYFPFQIQAFIFFLTKYFSRYETERGNHRLSYSFWVSEVINQLILEKLVTILTCIQFWHFGSGALVPSLLPIRFLGISSTENPQNFFSSKFGNL